ncbi:ribosome assembly factor SBDS [Cuniculiplasma sp. SKW4]|uniref:ribosome assembly factor SBDS n=1 Tax=Cuniculiplasma sp. SKW4 TaxID=3400171 RepID=UPI003FCF0669
MVKLDDAIVARLEHSGHKFEILVDPDAVEKIRNGDVDIEKDLASDQVFKDARKGEKAGEESIREVFKTDDIKKIAEEIVKKGQIQLTTEQRHKMQEMKKRMVIEIISKEGINPQTNAPNPPARIEAAMEEAKIHIDPFKPVNEQVNMVLKEIKPLIPIRMEKVKLAIRLKGDAYGRIYGEIARSGTILKEEWTKDGNWICVIEVSAGLYGEIISNLSRKAKDEIEIKKI